MLVQELAAHQQHGGNQLAVAAQGVPLLCQVQSHPQALLLAHGHHHKGLGQHGHGVVHGGHLGHDLRGLAFPLHVHVLAQLQAVPGQQIGQGILGSRALAGGVNGLSGQALDIGDGLAALFHHIQHAQGADGQHLHLSLGLVIQHGAQVGGHGHDVQLPLQEQRIQLVGAGSHPEVDGVGGFLVFRVVQQLHQAHGRGALQSAHPNGDGFLLGLVGGLGLLGAAGKQCGGHQHRQQQGYKFFHVGSPSREMTLEYWVLALTPGRRPILPDRAAILSWGASSTTEMMFTPRSRYGRPMRPMI